MAQCPTTSSNRAAISPTPLCSCRLDYGWDLNKVRSIGDRICNEYDQSNYLDRGDEHPHRIVLSVQANILPSVINRLRSELDNQGV